MEGEAYRMGQGIHLKGGGCRGDRETFKMRCSKGRDHGRKGEGQWERLRGGRAKKEELGLKLRLDHHETPYLMAMIILLLLSHIDELFVTSCSLYSLSITCSLTPVYHDPPCTVYRKKRVITFGRCSHHSTNPYKGSKHSIILPRFNPRIMM